MIRAIALIGRFTRARMLVLFETLSLCFTGYRLALSPATWRRPMRAEFARRLRQSTGGGLPAILFLGVILGFGMVFQGVVWLSLAGQQDLLGSLLVTILMRELIPVLVGLLLLGRSGLLGVMELGGMQADGTLRALASQGLDPMLLLVVPMIAAFSVAGFTLGVMFLGMSLLFGFLFAGLLSGQAVSVMAGFDNVLVAMQPIDFAVFPAKLVLVGGVVGAIAAITALGAGEESPGRLLPRGFVRGVPAVFPRSAFTALPPP